MRSAVFTFVAMMPKEAHPMSAEANKTASRRILEEGFGQGKLAVADEFVAPNATLTGPVALPDPAIGPAASKQVMKVYRTAFPDLKITVDEQIAEGDTVMTRWTASGTNTGQLLGMPATNKPANGTDGIEIDYFKNGKIVRSWGIYDRLGMMTKLGVVPPLGAK
jgi:predicted ester cyclase